MSEEILAAIISVAILAALFLWVPTLEVCGPRCQKFFLARRTRREEATVANKRALHEQAVLAMTPTK